MEKPQLEDGYTRIANEILEKLCTIKLSAYQTRIIFCILRKTYGFQKKEDWISNSQFVAMTGIRPSHVSRTVSELLRMNIVTKRGNKLSFQKNWKLWSELPNGVRRHDIVTKRGNTVTKRGNSELPNGGYTKETITKDNIQKKYISLSDFVEKDFVEIAERYRVPISFVKSKYDDLSIWLEEKPNRGKGRNLRMTLMSWVKKDALSIMEKERTTVNKFTVTQV